MGAGRAGCFVTVGIAHELLVSPDPNPPVWDKEDQNIVDHVIRGIRRCCRPGLVETAQQYEACHLILDRVLSGPRRGNKENKRKKGESKKWNPFKKKSQVNTFVYIVSFNCLECVHERILFIIMLPVKIICGYKFFCGFWIQNIYSYKILH